MAFVDDLKDLMADTATHAALASRDSYGVPTYGSGTSYTARLIRKNKLVRDAQGQQVLATAELWIAGTPAIRPDDKITLSDGSTPPIAAVERYQDEDGSCFVKVFFL